MRRSSGFWAAGTLRIASRSCSNKLARRFSVILLFRGESPPGINSALELSMLGLVRVMSSLLAIGGREKETQDFYIPLCNGAKITNSGCFYAVFPSIPFRFVEPRKAAPETLQVSATSGMTTRRFSPWKSQMLQRSHQFMWKTVLLETINSP